MFGPATGGGVHAGHAAPGLTRSCGAAGGGDHEERVWQGGDLLKSMTGTKAWDTAFKIMKEEWETGKISEVMTQSCMIPIGKGKRGVTGPKAFRLINLLF
mmetsp:Transcript_114203/g.262089  ORF Transcript_114203/g.262089 Transcript_114203/m.262089 type:complete len:100 (+) Transcript_114203:222-521(+)